MSRVLVLGINIPSMYMPNLDNSGYKFNSNEILKNFKKALKPHEDVMFGVEKLKLLVNVTPYTFPRSNEDYVFNQNDRMRLVTVVEKFMEHIKKTFPNIFSVEYSRTSLNSITSCDLLLDLDSEEYKVFFYIKPEKSKPSSEVIKDGFPVREGKTSLFTTPNKSNPMSL